jgi:hypothetical protein
MGQDPPKPQNPHEAGALRAIREIKNLGGPAVTPAVTHAVTTAQYHLVAMLGEAVDHLAQSSDTNTASLRGAIDRLVLSSNNNTETMARLQERVVDLTGTYVRLQGWVVRLTIAALVVGFFSVAAASIQAYRALYPVPTQILAQPIPARAAAPSPMPVRDAASQPAPASAAKNPR